MEVANIIFRLMAASQVLLFLVILLFSMNSFRVRVIGGALLSASIAYFVMPLMVNYLGVSGDSYLWLYPSLIPCFTLFFVWVVFEEKCDIPVWLIAILLVDIALSLWFLSNEKAMPNDVIPKMISQTFKILTVIGAVSILWQGRDNDLVEIRLKVRWYFILLLVLTVLGVAIVEMFNLFDVPLTGEALGMGWMFLLALIINIGFFRLNPSLDMLGPQTPKPKIELGDDTHVDNLLARMQNERLYADHDLRVGSLADIIGMPEYQLRKKINQSLGFRNFNQFVNGYRIEEAGQRLLSEPRTPVLSIALDVGFRSISSFNSAFQAHFGVSPTAYRSQTVTDS